MYKETVSIHATLAGGDDSLAMVLRLIEEFLSTPPSRVATFDNGFRACRKGFIVSIHATLAGGDFKIFVPEYNGIDVSIHATLAGGDFSGIVCANRFPSFLSTPPSRVATVLPPKITLLLSEFLSTPPSRVATLLAEKGIKYTELFLSTPPSRVATFLFLKIFIIFFVSIHATLAGGDCR